MRAEPVRTALSSPPIDDAGDARLVELIRAEIERDGPITFARFMERALYEPGLGYYATSEVRATRAGDFLTAPELHPIFGHTLARQLDEMWQRLERPRPFVVREYGAGSGVLGALIADGLLGMGSDLAEAMRYEPVEIAGRRLGGGPAETRMVGCIVANEFIDALPVHRVVMRDGLLCEVRLGWTDGRFVDVESEPSDPSLREWFARRGIALADGQRAEVNLRMLDWLAEVARDLERGFVLILDYGAPAAELYGPARATGTLRAFRGQHVSSDVLTGIGHQDITAHVDLDALEDAARDRGLDVLGRTSQARFLLGSGLDEAYATLRPTADNAWESATSLRAAIRRLIDPQALGGYAVVVLGKGVSGEPPLRGLA